MITGKGDFIGGQFHAPMGDELVSHNPVDGAAVYRTKVTADRVAEACEAAAKAQPAWAALSFEERWEALCRFRAAIKERTEGIAEAITLENGKLIGEARTEVGALVGRFDIIRSRILSDMPDGTLPGFPQESLRHHPHGVVAVLGPFNFPLHLCHAHVVPALLLGNTVVMKPSEVTPLSGERYAEAAEAAGLPAGVLNLVQGTGASGAALGQHESVRGLAFTGSWPTGRRILESALDRPEMLVALEMGGKNTSIVFDDADIRQAAHEIVIGGYLSTGQRCTCTDRVLVQRGAKERLIAALVPLVSNLRMGDPHDKASFAGPLSTAQAKASLAAAIEKAEAAGAKCVAKGQAADGGNFVVPTLHVLPDGVHDIPGYTDHELFGPDVHIEVFEDVDEVVEVLNASPFGLANSVFSRSREPFEALFERTLTGILNWNRSTNQASPRLPFGGTGRSGNFRPAGSYAPRNLAVPVAVQTNQPGAMALNPHLSKHLVAPDLEDLAAAHHAEEQAEIAFDVLDTPRPMAVRRPAGGHLPQSEMWLERFYAGNRMVREKKPGVFDHRRSQGAWFVSVDDEPMSVLDGMSQTATLVGGFADDHVVNGYLAGRFGETAVASQDVTRVDQDGAHIEPVAKAYADKLRELVPGLPHVSFVNSGAEANEKALALCHAQYPSRKKMLAFEGSFHGRTLLALHASFNPSKRAPFEIAGHEVDFAPFPLWLRPNSGEPATPVGWQAAWAKKDVEAARTIADAGDSLLHAEFESLLAVHETLAKGEHFAVSVEPMQSEGGDRYATARFHRALRLLTRAHDVALIMDEVQTGFGLGGAFAWHTGFDLVDAEGKPDTPDCVVFAKRAQAGVCMSRFVDLEPTDAHGASLVRGLMHAELMANDAHAARVQAWVQPRLFELVHRYPELVHNPRLCGYALAFDLPSPQLLNAYLGQRFWRGAIVFGAGSRTVRYRLSRAFSESDVDILFETVRRSLSWLDANPGCNPPEWQDFPRPSADTDAETRVRIVHPSSEAVDVEALLDGVVALEERVYEPERRDPREKLAQALAGDGVAVVAEAKDAASGKWQVVGSALASPLEDVEKVDGPAQDENLGQGNTLYSLAITVDPTFRGRGLGAALKSKQLLAARGMTRADGSSRYAHLTGRNRIGATDAMQKLNRMFGAYEVERLEGQYEGAAAASYYRISLAQPVPADRVTEQSRALSSGVARPFAKAPESLRALEAAGRLFGATVNKLTICNYITPDIVRAVEWAGQLLPNLPHLYLTSSRDESFDKTVRSLRYHRKGANAVLGLEGGYVGHTTAAARSLSDPAVHRQGPSYFEGFSRVPHPSDGGVAATVAALDAAVASAGGADQVIGLFIEPIQERTGRVISTADAEALDAWRGRTGVPIVFVETASAYHRSGVGAFASSALPLAPDAVAWWASGQTGFIHISAKYFVAAPLTMVSTWDGDEISLIRMHHQSRASRRIDVATKSGWLEAALAPVSSVGGTVLGMGLYRVIHLVDEAKRSALLGGLENAGWSTKVFANGAIPVAPGLDLGEDDFKAFGKALSKALA